MIDLFCQINDNLWVSDGILSKKDCSLLRREALPKLSKSDVLNHSKDGVGEYKYYRTSKGAVLPKSDYSTQHEVYDVISKIEKLIESLTCLPPENQEYLQVLQYSEGQEYKKHHDFFHKDSYYYEETMARGGQRLYSFLF